MPEHVAGNIWRIIEDERVTGRVYPGKHTLTGPQVVRVEEYPDLGENGMMRIQGDNVAIEVDGLDFPSCVRRADDKRPLTPSA